MKYTVLFMMSLLLAGCSVARHPVADKVLINISSITQAIDIEKQEDSHSDVVAPDGASWFELIPGTIPVTVTAAHATKPFREGEYRFSDGGGTAALA